MRRVAITLTCAYGKMSLNMSVGQLCLPHENPSLAGVFPYPARVV